MSQLADGSAGAEAATRNYAPETNGTDRAHTHAHVRFNCSAHCSFRLNGSLRYGDTNAHRYRD